MAKEKINICLVTTAYSFLIYLILNEYNKKDIFIFGPNFPRKISKKINHIQLPKVNFTYGIKMAKLDSLHGIYENIRGYALYFYTYLKLRVIITIKTINKEVTVYGHAQNPFSYMFFENENSNILEDGVENYTVEICETHKINKVVDTFLHICGIYYLKMCETYGSHKNIKNVYLTNEYNHPLIKDKVRVIDINKLWNSLPNKRQNEIFEIFNVPMDIDFNGKTALILTQPFFEDGLTTLPEEINIYKVLIKKFENYQIIIKPHPRDKKDYEKIFPNAKIIDGSFPIEMLNFIGINPTIVSSVISTALLNFKKSKIYVYDGPLNNEYLTSAREELLILLKKNNLELIEHDP